MMDSQQATVGVDPCVEQASSLGAFVRTLVETKNDPAAAAARIALGVVMLPHGLQKTVGWFGGYGFSGTMDYFTTQAGLPWLVAFTVIAAESLGAIGLIVGLGARVAAAGIIAVMVGAIATVHYQYGFFADWFGNQGGQGYEYHLLAIGLAAVVVLAGAGSNSIDRLVSLRLGSSPD